MILETIAERYLILRKRNWKLAASDALRIARNPNANPRATGETAGAMRGGADFELFSTRVFWCERPDAYLRRVGFADEVAKREGFSRSIDHKGWFLDSDFQDEVARGVVFQLPAKDGKTRFMYGVADPHNDRPAILAHEVAGDIRDAAIWADQLAERYAEDERDYREASNARMRHDSIADDIQHERRVALRLLMTRRAGTTPLGGDNLCAMVARDAREAIAKLRREREELAERYGDSAGWRDAC